jgi:hypothetical protein
MQTIHTVAWKEPILHTIGVSHEAKFNPPPLTVSQLPTFSLAIA